MTRIHFGKYRQGQVDGAAADRMHAERPAVTRAKFNDPMKGCGMSDLYAAVAALIRKRLPHQRGTERSAAVHEHLDAAELEFAVAEACSHAHRGQIGQHLVLFI